MAKNHSKYYQNPSFYAELHIIHVRFEQKYISPFDLDVNENEQYVNITSVTWKLKTHPEHHCNMYNNVKQDLIDYS